MEDALSALLRMAQPAGAVDLRCQVGGPFEIPHEQGGQGEAPFHLIAEGSCFLRLPGRAPLALAEGDFVLLAGGSPHLLSGRADPAAPPSPSKLRLVPVAPQHQSVVPTYTDAQGLAEVEILCGRFRYPAGAGELFFNGLPAVVHVSMPPQEQGTSKLILDILHREVGSGAAGSAVVVAALCLSLLTMALRSEPPGIPDRWTVLNDRDLVPAVRGLFDSMAEPPSVLRAAQLCGMSRASFARRFKSVSGQSWGEFSGRVRMMAAAEQLVTGDDSVAVVANRVGYRSAAAFREKFSTELGRSPRQFRRLNRSG